MQGVVDGVQEGRPKDKAKTLASSSQVRLILEFSHSFDRLKFSHLFITNNFNGTITNKRK